jgi:hypothetical protein
MHNVGLALAVLLAACAARAQPAPPAGDVRSLQGTEDTQTEARAETDVPGTVTAVEAGAVTVRAAGADLRLEVPPARAGALRPGTAVTLEVVLIARAPARARPAGDRRRRTSRRRVGRSGRPPGTRRRACTPR